MQVLHWGNPLAPAINAIRGAALRRRRRPLGRHDLPVVAAVVSLLLGAWVFRRLDDRIAVEL